MEDYTLNPGEQVVLEDPNTMFMKKKMFAVFGCLTLTNQRLLFVKNPNPGASALVQMLVKSTRRKLTHDIPLSSIRNVETTTYGLSKSRMSIDIGAEKPVIFQSDKHEKFMAALQQAKR